MADTCAICGHERTQGRCWRLTCPANGARPETLEIVRVDPGFEHLDPRARTMEETSPYTRRLMTRAEVHQQFGLFGGDEK